MAKSQSKCQGDAAVTVLNSIWIRPRLPSEFLDEEEQLKDTSKKYTKSAAVLLPQRQAGRMRLFCRVMLNEYQSRAPFYLLNSSVPKAFSDFQVQGTFEQCIRINAGRF